jgi:hypothetical protein
MGTTNGVGTMYYGWRHSTDASATATLWFVFFWLPVVPLQRHRLKVLTNLRAVKHLTPFQALTALLGAAEAVEQTRYQVLARERVAIREVLMTYIWTYAIGPALVAWPAVLFWAGDIVLQQNPSWRESDTMIYVVIPWVMLVFGNPIAVVLIALRRARGFNGGLFE